MKAGAGSGKTTTLINTLICRILQYHKENQVFPRVAVSTFTKKATRELKERIIIQALKLKNKELVQYVSHSSYLQISTLHGLFYRFIQFYGYMVGFSPGVTIINSQEAHILLVNILKNLIFKQQLGIELLNHYSFEELSIIVKQYVLHRQLHEVSGSGKAAYFSQKKMQDILNIEKCKIIKSLKIKQNAKDSRYLLELQNQENHLDILEHLCLELNILGQHILPLLIQKQKELSQITLNDLEILTLQILKKSKNISHLKHSYYDFWFLDEYQDISPIQKDILNIWNKNSQVFIVGDPQQSIYYFRGSDTSVFLQKEKEITQKSQIKYLKTNYRSSPELVAFFNDFFPSKTFRKMETKSDIYQKQKEVAQFILLDSNQKNSALKQELELTQTLNRVQFLLKQGVKPQEIAILSRQNKALNLTAQYLKNNGLSVHLQSTGNFQKRREIIDALFLLRFILNPHDNENLIGLLRTPYCRISDQILTNSMKQIVKQPQSLWQFLLQEQKFLKIILKLNLCLEQATQIGIVQSFQNAIEELAFIDVSYYQDSTGVMEANLWKLIYCLKQYIVTGSHLSAFVDDLFYENLQLPLDQMNYSQNALSAIESSGIQLMTIHTAKGLEFKHVILIQVCKGLKYIDNFTYFTGQKHSGDWLLCVRDQKQDKRIHFLFKKQIQAEQQEVELQEFDRLLYVALTRAQQTVTLIGSGKPEKNSWPIRFPFFSNFKLGHQHRTNYSYWVK